MFPMDRKGRKVTRKKAAKKAAKRSPTKAKAKAKAKRPPDSAGAPSYLTTAARSAWDRIEEKVARAWGGTGIPPEAQDLAAIYCEAAADAARARRNLKADRTASEARRSLWRREWASAARVMRQYAGILGLSPRSGRGSPTGGGSLDDEIGPKRDELDELDALRSELESPSSIQ